MRPVEFNGAINRTTDYSTMKQSEDAKPSVDQQNLLQASEKRTENEAHQVNEQQDTYKEEMNPKNGGNGSYEDRRNKKRKKKIEEEGIVQIKSTSRFDFKI